MPTVTGPLHSDQATGQFAKSIIFQRRGKRTIAKKYAAPKEPNTADQLAVQAFTKQLAQLWPTLSTVDQLTWATLANERGYDPANAFFVENWKRHRAGQDVTHVWPPVDTPAIETCEVTALDQPLVPDCAGTFDRIADYAGFPAYKSRTQPFLFIYFMDGMQKWAIADTTDETPVDYCWLTADGPNGEYYSATPNSENTAIVSGIPT